jgi:hypothetical protein
MRWGVALILAAAASASSSAATVGASPLPRPRSLPRRLVVVPPSPGRLRPWRTAKIPELFSLKAPQARRKDPQDPLAAVGLLLGWALDVAVRAPFQGFYVTQRLVFTGIRVLSRLSLLVRV